MIRKIRNNRTERFERVRRTYGERGSRTSFEAFGREIGAGARGVYRGWELGEHDPQRGHEELAECYARCAGIRRAKADPRKLAIWAFTGEGAFPEEPGGGAASRGLRSAKDAVLEAVHERIVSVEDASTFFRVAEALSKRDHDLGSVASYLLQLQRAG